MAQWACDQAGPHSQEREHGPAKLNRHLPCVDFYAAAAGDGGAARVGVHVGVAQQGQRHGPSFAYSLPVHASHTRRDRVAPLTNMPV